MVPAAFTCSWCYLIQFFYDFFYMCFQKNANTLSKKKGNFDCGCETEPSENNFDDETFHAEKKLQWFILIYYMIQINSKK